MNSAAFSCFCEVWMNVFIGFGFGVGGMYVVFIFVVLFFCFLLCMSCVE